MITIAQMGDHTELGHSARFTPKPEEVATVMF